MRYITKRLLPKSTQQTTIELRHMVSEGFELFDKYPIWRESHREELNKKIINHYFFRQIGFETAGRFRFELNTRMNEIMPYYVELYKTTLFNYNPLENYNMVEEFKDTSKGSEEGSSSAKGSSTSKYSDTPHSRTENIDDGYLTSQTDEDNESTGTNQSTNTRDDTHTGMRKGNIGVTSTQQLITQERELIINIDRMIIEELQDLFLGVY